MNQCSRLLKTIDNKRQHLELESLQKVLNSKIRIVSPALDLIEFKSSRGNVFLGNAAALAKTLHRDIVTLGKRLEKAAATEEEAQELGDGPAQTTEEREVELSEIIRDIKRLLARIDSDIPLLQLAITASGESLSTALPPSISPSRLLQASMCLVVGDTQFSGDPCRPVQIGPSFTLSLYMLFLGHSIVGKAPSQAHKDGDFENNKTPYGIGPGERKPIWQEVLHKARIRICRIPRGWEFYHSQGFIPSPGDTMKSAPNTDSVVLKTAPLQEEEDEFSYFLEIIEDLDDGRTHDEDQTCNSAFDGISNAGVKEAIPMYQISKLFYTDSGRILNIGNQNDFENSSVLLLKRDPSATSPTKTMEHMEPEEDDEEEETCELSEDEEEQSDVDRQLRGESMERDATIGGSTIITDQTHRRWIFPSHLDPEWLALEVFAEDDTERYESESDSSSGDDEDDSDGGSSDYDDMILPKPMRKQRKSLDTHLAGRVRNFSIASPSLASQRQKARGAKLDKSNDGPTSQSLPPRVAQSPYGSVTSSLSLLEMLVRLTSLQQFQQTSHLAIPDHILTFFLEETSATGLRGEARWQAKRAAKQRMGFDPFTDTPTKQETPKGQRKGML
ncbi:Ran-specific GTPase-activating protein 30 [Sporothrix stenoceras]|uniref:Ran-specific GTPase-activating protein 30 n=1 Tax=Sporothrix stenoceras TaxID=5173 RepID=A0ABR3ZH99_9PEZI